MIETLGLLHPAMVHLPIGIILITLLYEWSKGKDSVFLWGCSAFSALLAMGSGIILLRTGLYEGLNMFLHLVTGILTTIVCFLIYYSKSKGSKLFNAQNSLLKFLVLALLLIGGHFGAELTHGEEYLPFQKKEEVKLDFSNQEEVILYSDIIEPIFAQKCIRCHETIDARGKLNMETHEGLLSDMYGDPAVLPGNLLESEIYKRINLKSSNRKYMPPSGPDLTYADKKLIEWWISSGASFTDNVKDIKAPDHIKLVLEQNYNIDLKEKSFYEKTEVPQLSDEIMSELENTGFNISPLATNTNFLDINIKGKDSNLNLEKLNLLSKAASQITWLDLSDSNFDDSMISAISGLENITKLKLQNTKLGDTGIEQLDNLNQLTILNIYGTDVSDASITTLGSFSNLEKLYIWQTKITEEGIERLKNMNAQLEIIGAAK